MSASSTASPQALTARYGKQVQEAIEPLRIVAKRKPSSLRSDNILFRTDTSLDAGVGADVDYLVPILPRQLRAANLIAREDAVVLQIWEGTVLEVDSANRTFCASLHAKSGQFEDHVGDIHFEWVMDQDFDLVVLGGVFYLTLYRGRRPGGTIVNSQELRFRRLPAWTAGQVAQADALADAILLKVRARPTAE